MRIDVTIKKRKPRGSALRYRIGTHVMAAVFGWDYFNAEMYERWSL